MTIDFSKYVSQAGNLLQVPGMPTGPSFIPPMSDMQKTLINKLKNGQSSTTILNSSPNIAKDSFQNSGVNFIDPKIVDNTKTGNFSPDQPNNLKNYNSTINSAMNSFSSGSQNMTSGGLAFIASTTDKAIDGIDLPTGINSITDQAGLGAGQLGRLAGLGGEAMSSAKNALKAVTSNLQSSMSIGKQAISAVQSGLGDVQKNLISPIKDIAITASLVTDPRMISGLISSNLDFLPPQMSGMIGYQAGSAFNSMTGGAGSKINDLTRNVYAIDSLVGNLTGMNNGINQYNPYDPYGQMGYGRNGYPTISGMNGQYIPGYSSYNGSSSEFDQMASAINQLCGNQTHPQYQDFNANKSLYDMLMMLAMAAGAGGLLAALMNCNNGGGGYHDARSNLMMYNMSQTVSYNGDPYTYRQMLDSAGPGYMQSPTNGILGLLTKSDYNTQNNADINWAMSQYGLSQSDLIRAPSVGRYQPYDASRMTVLQQGDRRYSQQYASQQDYSAVNMAVQLFSNLFN